MASALNAGCEEVNEKVIQRSEINSDGIGAYEDIFLNTPDKSPGDYAVLLPTREKKDGGKGVHKLFPFRSGMSFKRTKEEKEKMSEKFGKTLDKGRIGEIVERKFSKIKKQVERITSRDKDKKDDKPSSLSEFFHPKPAEHAVPNTYQTDIRKPKLPDRNKVKTLPKSDSDHKKRTDYQNTTLPYYRANLTVDCASSTSNNMPVKKDVKPEPEDDYLEAVPRTKGVYRSYLLQKQKGIKGQLAEKPEQGKKKAIGLKNNDSHGACEDMGCQTKTGRDEVHGDSMEDEFQTAESETVVEKKIFGESKSGNSRYNEEATEVYKTSDKKSIGKEEVSLKQLKLKDVRQVLADLCLEQYADIFESNRIDGHMLSILTFGDLTDELGMKKLEARRLDEFIKSGHVPT